MPNQSISTKTINIENCTHFFASNHLLPRSPGRRGVTRSSARNKAWSLSSILRASYGLNFPLSFVMPITLDINLIPWVSSRSLYSRWGSFTIRQTADDRGSTSGWTIGLGAIEHKTSGGRWDMHWPIRYAHLAGLVLLLRLRLLDRDLQPEKLFFAR